MKKTQHKRKWISCLCLLLAFIILPAASAVNAAGSSDGGNSVDPVNQPDNFSVVLYDNTNGLPTSEANAIVQTSEGFIWIGSYAGLIRYDGNTFERMDSSNGIASVVSLFVDSRDRLWIGTNDNGVAVMEQGELRKWGKAEGMPSAKVSAITEGKNGTIYLATSSGIAMIDSEYRLHTMDEPELAEVEMRDIRTGNDGTIYGTTDLGDLIMIREDRLLRFISIDDNPLAGVGALLPDPEVSGRVYQEAADFALYYVDLNDGFTILKKFDVEPLKYLRDIEYIDGRLWICGGNGIGVLDGDDFHLLEDVPMNNNVGHIMTDYLGNLWFTSTRQGVMKVVPNQFSDLSERYGLSEMVVNSTCMYDGKLFVGTDTGLIVLDDNGVVSSVPLTKAATVSGKDLGADDLISMLEGYRIRSIIRDSRDRLWFSTWRGQGLLCYDRGEITAFDTEAGTLSNNFRAICERKDGSILVAVSGGVNVIRDGRVVTAYGKEDGIIIAETLSVAEGTDGDILVGSNGGGIYIFNDNGMVKTVGVEGGLPSDIVMRLKRDQNRDLIWIVTSSAIAYMTPDYQVTTVQKFPYSNNFDLFENSKGDMWVLSSNGIYVTSAEELVANEEITPVHYSIANGLPCITTANSYSELTAEGDLYIAGTTGICKVNIEQPFENIDDLKATVPFVEVDGRTLYPNEDGTFTIPSNTQKLTVPSFVFNYALSDPQVSYQLVGFERSSTTIKRSEIVPVDYTNLRGGTYHFVMQLKDSMGRGNREVSVKIVKEKAFYEQAWFYILVGLAAALTIALLVRMYIRRKMRELEAKHREQAERERMENELQTASNIQANMLPNNFPAFPGRKEFELYATMDPAKEVGGDFYDFFLVDDDHLALVVADVSGKGVPAALFMMTARTLIKDAALEGLDPSSVMFRVNERLDESNKDGLFVTVWLGILELSTGELTFSDAGHEKLLLYQQGAWRFLPKGGCTALAVLEPDEFEDLPESYRYRNETIRLQSGDLIFQYTDGVTEATNAQEELFGDDRLLDAMNGANNNAPESLLPYLRRRIDEFVKEAPQFDDITMLGLRYLGKGE